jgi:type IV pilus assembly protein PilV
MNHRQPLHTNQAGFMLLEAMIGILIFSVGILGLVGLMATAAKESAASSYRTEAALLANQIISSARTNVNRTLVAQSPLDTAKERQRAQEITSVQNNFDSHAADPTEFNDWVLNQVNTRLPNATGLNAPVVNVANDGTMTITINWQVPGHTTTSRYATVAQIR